MRSRTYVSWARDSCPWYSRRPRSWPGRRDSADLRSGFSCWQFPPRRLPPSSRSATRSKAGPRCSVRSRAASRSRSWSWRRRPVRTRRGGLPRRLSRPGRCSSGCSHTPCRSSPGCSSRCACRGARSHTAAACARLRSTSFSPAPPEGGGTPPGAAGCHRCSQLVGDPECDHTAGGHAGEDWLARLRCAHEDRQQPLMPAGGEAGLTCLRDRDRAVRRRCHRGRFELVERDRGCVDRRALHRAAVARRDLDVEVDAVRAPRHRG
jgi:hypothetical protein